MLKTHRDSGADATVAVIPVSPEQASEFGILKMDATGRIVHFDEKPPAVRLPALRVGAPGRPAGTPGLDGHLPLQARRPRAVAGQPASGRLRPSRHPRRGSPAARAGARLPRLLGGRRGRSSRTSRPTWRCASRSRRLISTTRIIPSTPIRGSCRPPSWSAATSTARSSPRAASCMAPRSTGPSSASAAGSAPSAASATACSSVPTSTRRWPTWRRPSPAASRRWGSGRDVHRERHHRQERAHRQQRPDHQRDRHQGERRRRLLHPRGDRHRPQKRRHPRRDCHLVKLNSTGSCAPRI